MGPRLHLPGFSSVLFPHLLLVGNISLCIIRLSIIRYTTLLMHLFPESLLSCPLPIFSINSHSVAQTPISTHLCQTPVQIGTCSLLKINSSDTLSSLKSSCKDIMGGGFSLGTRAFYTHHRSKAHAPHIFIHHASYIIHHILQLLVLQRYRDGVAMQPLDPLYNLASLYIFTLVSPIAT